MSEPEKINILLVDDQPGKLLTYEALLQDTGENLLMASSATEALQLLLRYEVAVILIDVCMPDLDGFELAKMIREHPRFSRTAIIFVSAIHLAETDFLRGYDAGAVDYLPVPVVPELLRAKVRVFVELYRKTKQLELLNAELEHRVAERTAALELSNSRLLKSEQGRRLSLAAANMGSWEYDAGEDRWHCDEGLNRILGIADSSHTLGPDAFLDIGEWHKFFSAFDGLSCDNSTLRTEMRIRRRDGQARICHVAAAASFARNGQLERIDGVMVDISDSKEAERVQRLLAGEVDHRARNALANVQAIMHLTRADTLQEYATKLQRRVHALAHTHELLSSARWQGADIRRLVCDELAPYGEGRTEVDGPTVILAPEKAQSLAMVLHELATNAAKYGALSVEGRVKVSWTFDQNVLDLTWIESGGPAVEPPSRHGFGTKIIQASGDEARGDAVELDWSPTGLRCRLRQQCATHGGDIASPTAPHDTPALSDSRRRVLVVEDEALVGMLTCDYLEELGYVTVGPFADIQRAQAAAQTEVFDLAVLDVNLAGKPIYPVAELLRAKGVPFIFLTGFSEDSINPEFGGITIVSKPIAKNALMAAIGDSAGDIALRQTA